MRLVVSHVKHLGQNMVCVLTQHGELLPTKPIRRFNVSDVLKTKALFELIVADSMIFRGDGELITLARPVLPA